MSRSCLNARPFILLCSILFVFSAVGAPALAGSTEADRSPLAIERVLDTNQIWIETVDQSGQVKPVLLRETSASVTPGRTGSDPSGAAHFATWNEDGERWFSFSRDAGQTWIEARSLRLDMRLRDANVMPGQPMPATPKALALPPEGRLFLVQFLTVGLPEWRDSIAALGAEVFNYLPHNTHIVRVDDIARVQAIRQLDFVERIEPYQPYYRISGDLREWMDLDGEAAAADPRLRVNALALEWGEAGKDRIAEAAWSIGATVIENWPNGHIMQLEVDRGQLRKLSAHNDVLWIDRWTPPSNDMDLVREDAGTNFIENNYSYCGDGVRGEVMDSGYQLDHPDFDGIIEHGTTDLSSHGTSCYGIVFGNGARDGDGDAQGLGHMPCAEQGIAADYGFLGDRFAHTQELKEAPYFASFQTNSWGASQIPNYSSVSQEMDDIIWRLDIAITQSQSNTGNQNSRPQAWAKNIISVGGIKHKNTLDPSDDDWTNGASIGPAEDGRTKPDVNYWYDSIYTTTTGSGYTQFGGTSAATPEVAGILGLMVQMWADNVWETDPEGATVFEKQPKFSTIKALLINNAKQYDFTGTGDDLTRTHQGWGRPNLELAHERSFNSFIINEEVLLELSDFGVYEIDVPPGETELKVTMVYPDPPGTTSSSMHRINNLDLKVTSPSGTIYHGNVGLDVGTHSTAGGVPNELDTVENVFVLNPEVGEWEVEISAPEINQDAHLDTPEIDAAFALVVTGATGTLIQSSEGRVRLDDDFYSCDTRVGIRVIDGNVGAGSINVNISSDTESTPETVTLNETRPGSGKFSGEIFTSTDPAQNGDALLSLAHNDGLTVEYLDADDGEGGFNQLRLDLANADCQQPIISNVDEENISDVQATVIWSTDESSSGEIVWGETVPPTTRGHRVRQQHRSLDHPDRAPRNARSTTTRCAPRIVTATKPPTTTADSTSSSRPSATSAAACSPVAPVRPRSTRTCSPAPTR